MKRWIRALRCAVPAPRKPGAHIHVRPCDACVAPCPAQRASCKNQRFLHRRPATYGGGAHPCAWLVSRRNSFAVQGVSGDSARLAIFPEELQTMTRPSGRAPDELRRVSLSRGFAKHAEGSVL